MLRQSSNTALAGLLRVIESQKASRKIRNSREAIAHRQAEASDGANGQPLGT